MILYGRDKFDNDIIWDEKKVVNGHMMIVGGSGVGKTYTIRKTLRELAKDTGNNFEAHVLDVHGDIDIGEDMTSTVDFSETADYGLQPLLISPDKDFGGVRKKIRSFIGMVNRTSRQLGVNQESSLMYSLEDLYRKNGFYIEDYKTWSLDHDPRSWSKYPKKNPTLDDLVKFLNWKYKQMLTGSNSKAVSALEQLNKTISSTEGTLKKLQKSQHNDDEVAKLTDKLNKQKEQAIQTYSDYIQNIENGRELDEIMKYSNADVVKSVYEKMNNLRMTGIFKPKKPNFDNTKKIKRYNIKTLNKEEQKMFVDVLLEDIFLKAKEKGEQEGVTSFIVVDEASIFMSKDDDHIINVISKEARKFGIGLILASQHFKHFSEDIIANSATKIVLGIDEKYHENASKQLKVPEESIARIIPKKTALIQIKNSGDLKNRFLPCKFV